MKGLDDGTAASTQETARSVVDEQVAASTQNQALSALLFLDRQVPHQDLSPLDALRAQSPPGRRERGGIIENGHPLCPGALCGQPAGSTAQVLR